MVTAPQDRIARKGSPSLFIPLVVCAVGAVAIIGLALFWDERDTHAATTIDAQIEDSTQRPTGAGVIADGVADGTREGLRNDLTEEELIDSSAASDLTSDNLETADAEQPVNPDAAMEQLDEIKEEMSDGSDKSGENSDNN